MDDLIRIIESRNVWVLIPLGAFLIPILGVIFDSFRKMSQAKNLEQSRREIAAYVAEGSMTPDDAAMILSAKPGSDAARKHRSPMA